MSATGTYRNHALKIECRFHEGSGSITAHILHAMDANMNATQKRTALILEDTGV